MIIRTTHGGNEERRTWKTLGGVGCSLDLKGSGNGRSLKKRIPSSAPSNFADKEGMDKNPIRIRGGSNRREAIKEVGV